MTDINKQIEEESREYRRSLIRRIRLNKANIDYILENGSINGSLMLDIDKAMIDYHAYSSRWRKVSEGLPESGEDVLAKCECGNLEVSFKGEMSGRIVWNCEDCDNIIEWKPID